MTNPEALPQGSTFCAQKRILLRAEHLAEMPSFRRDSPENSLYLYHIDNFWPEFWKKIPDPDYRQIRQNSTKFLFLFRFFGMLLVS